MAEARGPIEARYREQMRAVAHTIDGLFNGAATGDDRKVWFFLAAGNFDDPASRFNYISNAEKRDVRDMLRDVLGRLEERIAAEPPAPTDGQAQT